MKKVTIGELVDAGLASIQTGPFGTQLKAAEYVNSGRPLLNVRNVGLGNVRLEGVDYVSDATAERLRSHVLRSGDIVFGRKGAVERHAYIPEALDGAVQGSDCIRLRLDTKRMVPRFVSFALRTDRHRSWMQNQSSHGATMASLNQEIVRRIELPDPTFADQNAVASILGAIDDLIENNRRRIELLDQTAQAIYREWFVTPSPPWERQSFAQLATFLNGFAFKPSHWHSTGLPIVKIRELRQGVTTDTPRYHGVDLDPKYHIESGDLLFSWSAYLDAFIWTSGPALLNQHLFKVTPADGIEQSWLYLTLREHIGEFRARSQGTTMKHIKRAALSEVAVPVPPVELRRHFDARVRPIFDQVLVTSELQAPLTAMRDLLLPKLVTGEIDVSHLDLDALLEQTAA